MNIYCIADKDIIFNDNSHKSYENLIKRAQRPIPCVDSHISRHKRAQRPIPCVDGHASAKKKHPRLVAGTLSFVLRKSLVCGRTLP